MPAGKHKSRSLRRVFVRTPGSRVVMHYVKRMSGKAQCAGCGTVLSGVPRASDASLRNMSKSKKRPERPFGGVLCSGCSRRVIIEEARFSQ